MNVSVIAEESSERARRMERTDMENGACLFPKRLENGALDYSLRVQLLPHSENQVSTFGKQEKYNHVAD